MRPAPDFSALFQGLLRSCAKVAPGVQFHIIDGGYRVPTVDAPPVDLCQLSHPLLVLFCLHRLSYLLFDGRIGDPVELFLRGAAQLFGTNAVRYGRGNAHCFHHSAHDSDRHGRLPKVLF